MKFNAKQLDNIARVAGALCASSIIGASIGIFRPAQISAYEMLALSVTAVLTFVGMIYVLKD